MFAVSETILKRIYAKGRGHVFTPKSFLDLGARAAVDQALSRLARRGKIRRIARGLYDYPKVHSILGTLSPDAECIAQVLAESSGHKEYPSGAMAANILGLSTQVPAKLVYVTNGPSTTRKIAGCTIFFKHARVALIDSLPDHANYLIQALSYFGKECIDDELVQSCAIRLASKELKLITRVFPQLPGRMADVIRKIQRIQDAGICQAA